MEQDSLSKDIEQLAEELDLLIGIIEKSRKKGSTFDGIDLVNQGLMDSLNINLEEINNIPIEHFIATIRVDSEMNNNNIEKLGNLLFKTAKIFQAFSEKESAKRLFMRTLQIYLYLAKAEVEFPYERHVRIKELREILLQ